MCNYNERLGIANLAIGCGPMMKFSNIYMHKNNKLFTRLRETEIKKIYLLTCLAKFKLFIVFCHCTLAGESWIRLHLVRQLQNKHRIMKKWWTFEERKKRGRKPCKIPLHGIAPVPFPKQIQFLGRLHLLCIPCIREEHLCKMISSIVSKCFLAHAFR